jgi:FkbM family methyltransferase
MIPSGDYSKYDINRLRVSYPLNEKSLVLDVGAFMGCWFSTIYRIYGCNIIAYEPTTFGYTECLNHTNKKIILKKIGLFNENKKILISNTGDSSSIFLKDNTEEISVVDVYSELYNLPSIDLIKINVEGSEYEILERLIEVNFIKKIKNIQVQFHKFPELCDPINRRNNIREKLKQTHELTYDFEFIWENWQLKETI